MLLKKQKSALWIGLFTFFGLLLFCSLIVFIGWGKLFQKKEKFVLFFDNSLNGLETGAQVKMKGISIGEVEAILLQLNETNQNLLTPVVISINPDLLTTSLGKKVHENLKFIIQQQVNKGLRAKLAYQSYVTGRLFIELDFLESADPYDIFQNNVNGLPEIPTLNFELTEVWQVVTEILEKVNAIDFVAISQKTETALTHLDDGIQAIDFEQINETIKTIQNTFNSQRIAAVLNQAKETLQSFYAFSVHSQDKLGLVTDAITLTALKIQNSADTMEQFMNEAIRCISENSHLGSALGHFLQEGKSTLHSLKEFLELLERHPNILLTGKK